MHSVMLTELNIKWSHHQEQTKWWRPYKSWVICRVHWGHNSDSYGLILIKISSLSTSLQTDHMFGNKGYAQHC